MKKHAKKQAYMVALTDQNQKPYLIKAKGIDDTEAIAQARAKAREEYTGRERVPRFTLRSIKKI